MSVWLVLVLLGILLALALGVILGRLWVPGGPAQPNLFARIWAALTPDFDQFLTDRVTAQTIRLLVTAMLVFGSFTVAWALAAGVMRTAWLVAIKPDGVTAGLKEPLWQQSQWLFAGFLAWQMVRAVGGVLLICCAAGLAGAVIGFIFGIPRPISASEAPPAAAGGAVPPPGIDHRQAIEAWKLSTNLTNISDWLTTAITGVGLVEAKNILGGLAVAFAAADWLFGSRHGSPAVLGAVIIGGAVFGFLFAYLYAELVISRLIAAVSQILRATPAARLTMRNLRLTQSLAPRIPRTGPPETTERPTTVEIQAALQYQPIQFEDLIAQSGVTPAEVLSWARAKAILNDYRAAARGYAYLLGTMLAPRQP